jgi:erythritol transport system ATP-binding protein
MRGVAIVYISHRLEELVRIGDFITVLRDGRVTGHQRMANVDVGWIVRQMIGSASKDFAKTVEHAIGDEAFRAEDICLPRVTGGYEVDHVSLSVRKGEILGLYGLMGAGRSEFLDCVMGRRQHATGRIFVEERVVEERDVSGRIRRGLALIPEDRQREGLVSILSVASNLTMASLHKFLSGFHIVGSRERGAVSRAIRDMTIKVADPAQQVTSLSGGNQQKVVIAKWLMVEPRIILLNDPTRGIDVGTKQEIYILLRRLADEGAAIVFYTTDYDELIGCCDRALVLYNGAIRRELAGAEITERALIASALNISSEEAAAGAPAQ